METEIWRTVPSLPRYEASSLGRIRGPRGILKGCLNTYGYLRVTVRLGGTIGSKRDLTNPGVEKSTERKVHRLVAEAFLPESHTTETINHIDGDKLNNRPENLEWMTISENTIHNVLHLKRKIDPRRNDYLTPADVLAIRQAAADGEQIGAIAKRIGRSQGHVSMIVSRKMWKHV